MSKTPLSVTIICKNEEANIAKAVQSALWADEVLVIDSGSTDQTVALAQAAGARVIHNAWSGYGQQKNFAQQNAKHDWILNIDADEWISQALAKEIQEIFKGPTTPPFVTYRIPRRTYYLGRWIQHGGWYPNLITRLANRLHAKWTEPNVHEDLVTEEPIGELKTPIEHNAFPSISDQILTNLRFSKLGSQDLSKKGQRPSYIKLLLKPVGKFLETYVLKGGFRDGLRGFIISVNAAHSMFLKYAFLFEKEIIDKK